MPERWKEPSTAGAGRVGGLDVGLPVRGASFLHRRAIAQWVGSVETLVGGDER